MGAGGLKYQTTLIYRKQETLQLSGGYDKSINSEQDLHFYFREALSPQAQPQKATLEAWLKLAFLPHNKILHTQLQYPSKTSPEAHMKLIAFGAENHLPIAQVKMIESCLTAAIQANTQQGKLILAYSLGLLFAGTAGLALYKNTPIKKHLRKTIASKMDFASEAETYINKLTDPELERSKIDNHPKELTLFKSNHPLHRIKFFFSTWDNRDKSAKKINDQTGQLASDTTKTVVSVFFDTSGTFEQRELATFQASPIIVLQKTIFGYKIAAHNLPIAKPYDPATFLYPNNYFSQDEIIALLNQTIDGALQDVPVCSLQDFMVALQNQSST